MNKLIDSAHTSNPHSQKRSGNKQVHNHGTQFPCFPGWWFAVGVCGHLSQRQTPLHDFRPKGRRFLALRDKVVLIFQGKPQFPFRFPFPGGKGTANWQENCQLARELPGGKLKLFQSLTHSPWVPLRPKPFTQNLGLSNLSQAGFLTGAASETCCSANLIPPKLAGFCLWF